MYITTTLPNNVLYGYEGRVASNYDIVSGLFFWSILILFTQTGDSALTLADVTDVVVELVKAGANLDLQNEVFTYMRTFSPLATLSVGAECHNCPYSLQLSQSLTLRQYAVSCFILIGILHF